MSPKEKAEDLIMDIQIGRSMLNIHAIEIALILVKEIQKFGNSLDIREPMMYWNRVESELNKMKEVN